MPDVEVLKFGSSVLRSPDDLHVAVDEIYRRWRGGFRILAVVSIPRASCKPHMLGKTILTFYDHL